MKPDFLQAKAQADALYASVSNTSAALNEFIDGFPRGPMNLTPDHVKAMPQYKSLSKDYSVAFDRLRAFNRVYTKTFANELRDERNARRAASIVQNLDGAEPMPPKAPRSGA